VSLSFGAECVAAVRRRFEAFSPSLLTLDAVGKSVRFIPETDPSFPVSVYDLGDEVMVACSRWHTHCETIEEAEACVWWLLTPYARIVHELKGGILAAVWLERFEGSEWFASDPVYFINPEYPPDWRLGPGQIYRRRRYQQAVLPPPIAPEDFCEIALLDEGIFPPDSILGERWEQSKTPVGPSLFEPEPEDD